MISGNISKEKKWNEGRKDKRLKKNINKRKKKKTEEERKSNNKK